MVNENFFEKNGINVSRETFDKLKIFHDVLIKWNKTHNLIAQSTISDIWQRHILDSVQLVKFIDSDSQKIVDFGSGAGFPGLIIAIVNHHPVTLIESNQKKCFFLKEVQRLLNLDVHIISQRIEDLEFLDADVITARALDDLSGLLKFSHQHLKKEGKCFFLKGEKIDDEIKLARKKWNFRYVKHLSLLNQKSYILEIINIKKY
ncbi:MAG: 16S rRNA (guanine(527)-N(7))-methyltransferase RsmG [Janthinobacterium lividum]